MQQLSVLPYMPSIWCRGVRPCLRSTVAGTKEVMQQLSALPTVPEKNGLQRDGMQVGLRQGCIISLVRRRPLCRVGQ